VSRLPHIVVLGGGPAGCGAAYQLRRTQKATVTLLEKQDVVGGNAASFQWGGQWLDYGSHRLHHTVAPEILADIRQMLGDDFGDFARHGRIRLRGKWLHFPIQTVDLLRRLDKGFALGMARDMVLTKLSRRDEGDSYASVLLANLGPTMSRHFYFPYGRKMWGREPEELSGIQARKRVSAGSFGKLIRRLLKPVGGGNYYYMREGYGQISRAYARHAESLGAEVALRWGATSITRSPTPGYTWTVTAERDGEIVFVEVRARSGPLGAARDLALESVNARKQARLLGLAEAYLEAHDLRAVSWRVDVAAVAFDRGRASVEIIRHAVVW
jgi:protoporphyrinogen oxidase